MIGSEVDEAAVYGRALSPTEINAHLAGCVAIPGAVEQAYLVTAEDLGLSLRVDSGIDSGRADFGGRVIEEVNLSTRQGNQPGDGYGHGTAVASVAAGEAEGYVGAAPEARLVAVEALDDDGVAYLSDVIAAADWIYLNRERLNIRVANFSLHGTTVASLASDPLDRAVERLWQSGVVVVTAAGNYAVDGEESFVPFAPGNDPFVLTVGATDTRGSFTQRDDVAAPWSAWGYTRDGFAKPELSRCSQWSPSREPTARLPSSIPPTIQALLAARLEHLGELERGGAARAGVDHGTGLPAGGAAGSLAEQARSARSAAPSTSSSGDSSSVRSATRASGSDTCCSWRSRTTRCRRPSGRSFTSGVAEWLEGEGEEQEEVAGHHFERAYSYRAELGPVGAAEHALARRAATRLGDAGRRAYERGDLQAAVGLLSRAVELLEPGSAGRVELLADLGEALRETGNFDRAAAGVLGEVVETARADGDRVLEARAEVGRLRLRLLTDPQVTEQVVRDAEPLVAVFEEAGDAPAAGEGVGASRLGAVVQVSCGCDGGGTRPCDKTMRGGRATPERRRRA